MHRLNHGLGKTFTFTIPKSLPNDKILASTKMKAFADDKFDGV